MQQKDKPYRSIYRDTAFRFLFIFAVLFILLFPFPHSYIPDTGSYLSPYSGWIVKWLGDHVLHITYPYTSEPESDSTGLYILAALLLVLSLAGCLVWNMVTGRRQDHPMLYYWFTTLLRYYLAMQLMAYGFSKVFKWQFYLPEPNTLFTAVGNTYPDLLYWTSMGLSRPYTMFMGITEVLAALLLLFRRTAIPGAILATGVMINVLMVNLCFDISVKLYSSFLLLLSLVLAAPGFGMLYRLFIKKETVQPGEGMYSAGRYRFYPYFKALVICWLLADALAPYISSGNFNDDREARPLLHGAYDVKLFIRNGDTIPPLPGNDRWKRLFIHRRGYFITQLMNDDMPDHSLAYDTLNKVLVITDYTSGAESHLRWSVPDNSTFILNGVMGKDTLEIRMDKIRLDTLPAMQREFNWTTD